MTDALEIVLAGGVIKSLQAAHSWCGETHIQKSSYIAKHIKYVPFTSNFVLYKHGPFSFELNSTLNNMRSQGIVDVYRPGLGSMYKLNESIWKAMDRASDGIFETHEPQINKVCSFLALKNVGELERIATAIYVQLNFDALSKDEQKAKLIELKPHITPPQAELAFSESDQLLS